MQIRQFIKLRVKKNRHDLYQSILFSRNLKEKKLKK
jgi:hypothetical protein